MGAATPLLRMAVRNVRRNWRHSLGTLLSIATGFLAIGLFEGYLGELTVAQGETLSRQAMYGDLVVEREGASSSEGREDPWAFHLGEAEQAFLEGYLAEHRGEVLTRARFLSMTGLASTGKVGAAFLGSGYDVAEGARLRGELAWVAIAGKPLEQAGPASVLLAQGLGGLLDCQATSTEPARGPDGRLIARERPFRCRRPRVQLTTTTQRGQLNVVELEVAGLFSAAVQELDSRMLWLPLPQAQRLLDTKDLSMVTVALAPGVDPAGFAARLSAAAKARGLAVSAQRWQDHELGALFRSGVELLGAYRGFMVLVVVTIAAMSVLMTMMKAVSERTREIGTLRSLGFLRRHVLALFVVEAGLLALLACGVGALATVGATFAINHSGITYKAGVLVDAIPLAVRLVPGAFGFAAVFLSCVAMVAAIGPARRGARLGIPQALGHR
jgi:putative ABC transport system permease protein